jgi:hypothetical protein
VENLEALYLTNKNRKTVDFQGMMDDLGQYRIILWWS